MSTYRHTIARVGMPLPGAARAFLLRDTRALNATAWPLPVYGPDGALIGRGLGLSTQDGRVDAVVEYFTNKRPTSALRAALSEADLEMRDGQMTIKRAMLASLTAAPMPADPASPAQPDMSTPTDSAQQQPSGEDQFVITENVTVNLDLPIAALDTPWDAHAATTRVAAFAGSDTTQLGDAFLYHDPGTPGDTVDDYQFPVADIIDNSMQIVPQAVSEAGQLLDAGGPAIADISEEDLQSISDVIDELFAKVAAGVQGSESQGWDQQQPAEMGGGGGDAMGGCVDCGDAMMGDGITAGALVATTVELPIAPDDTPWNGSQAQSRVLAWAKRDGTVNARKLSQAYLWRDPSGDPQRQATYKLPVADVINGQLMIVPAAVRAALASLGGARGGVQGLSAAARQTVANAANRLMGRIRNKRGGAQTTAPAAGRTAAASSAFASYKRHLNPPDEFFSPMELPGPTPITVTADGEVFGHVADWKECHAAFASAGVCVTAPRSNCNYCRYHNGTLVTASGAQIRTGAYCVGGGHAPVEGPGSDIASATAHYDNVAAVPARGVMREDAYGPYFHGALTPGATDEQIYAIMAYPPSGDWRPPTPGEPIEMVAVTAVNTPGFLVRNSVTAAADGNVGAAILTHSSPYVARRSTERQIDGTLDPELAALRAEAIDALAASIGRTRRDELAELSAAVHG